MLFSRKFRGGLPMLILAFYLSHSTTAKPLKISDVTTESPSQADKAQSSTGQTIELDVRLHHSDKSREKAYNLSQVLTDDKPIDTALHSNASRTLEQYGKRTDIITPPVNLPHGFYVADMMVVCDSVDQNLEKTPEWYKKRDKLGVYKVYPDWKEKMRSQSLSKTDMIEYFWTAASMCQQCQCRRGQDTTKGLFSLSPNPGSLCPDGTSALVCMLTFGCVCTEFLWDRDRHPQKGKIDGKLFFYYGNKKYLKGPSGGPSNARDQQLHQMAQSGGFSQSSNVASEPSDCSANRVLVPGTEEPYFLEGPSVEKEPGCDLLALSGGDRRGYWDYRASSKFPMSKRGDKQSVGEEEEQEEKIGAHRSELDES